MGERPGEQGADASDPPGRSLILVASLVTRVADGRTVLKP
jgi:hypothetical protein